MRPIQQPGLSSESSAAPSPSHTLAPPVPQRGSPNGHGPEAQGKLLVRPNQRPLGDRHTGGWFSFA